MALLSALPAPAAPKEVHLPVENMPSIAAPTLDELHSMHLSPRKIIDDYLFADVRVRIAAGGMGKTTMALYEAMMVALRRPLWGNLPLGAVNTLIVSREDGRDTLLARLREIMRMAGLTDEERKEVLQRVRIMDIAAQPFRLSAVKGDMVTPNIKELERLISHIEAQGFKPDWLIFDPAVSFGVGESRVNDSEQGLIEAARILMRHFDCCVEFIHHTGKAGARERTTDQYSGRGGSSFADGARMVAVLQPVDANEWFKKTSARLEPGWSGMVLALPKMSYCTPQDPIYIRRMGWAFVQEKDVKRSADDEHDDNCKTVLAFMDAEMDEGRLYSLKNLEDIAKVENSKLYMPRSQLRAAVAELEVNLQIEKQGRTYAVKDSKLAAELRRGRKKTSGE